MASETFMSKLRSFLGIHAPPPRNDFRNPIWGSDDDDDGDELYTRHRNVEVYSEIDLHHMLSKHMQDMFKSFGGMFGDVRSFFHEDGRDAFTDTIMPPVERDNVHSNNIRDYYLKPGYHNNLHKHDEHKDIDLDGKLSSQEISGLLKKKDAGRELITVAPFDASKVPGMSFCQTIITTSVTKPDGSIETRRIVKSGNDIIEETTTSTEPDSRSPINPGLNPISSIGIIFSELDSMFKNFY